MAFKNLDKKHLSNAQNLLINNNLDNIENIADISFYHQTYISESDDKSKSNKPKDNILGNYNEYVLLNQEDDQIQRNNGH